MGDLLAEEQEQERMISILSSAVDPIVQINEKGIIQMVNNACCQVIIIPRCRLGWAECENFYA